ncbi:N-terminal glutamine amidase-domain-containing protein [Coprinopsis sp. MPI-PUGE-AT-0042]|nr:N-terminal glutamine amidase-domain-containing protein [Coprinopsis sp. MPI-PUGE-AT-0042]
MMSISVEQLQPPILPATSIYTSCYCEENVYLLCKSFLSTPEIASRWDVWAVFISNAEKKVALFRQKAASKEDWPVIWDYHVVLLLQPREGQDDHAGSEPTNLVRTPSSRSSWVYDFDTLLPNPCPFEEYLEMTFPASIREDYQRLAADHKPTNSCFRVIYAEEYLMNFASDRSHMIVQITTLDVSEGLEVQNGGQDGSNTLKYSSPPPNYDPIVGETAAAVGIASNLSDFVNMTVPGHGSVYDRDGISLRFYGSSGPWAEICTETRKEGPVVWQTVCTVRDRC